MLNVTIESENYLISKNPLKPIKLFKERPAEDRIITRDEYYRLLEAAPEYFGRIVFYACNTAMRLMEILDLQFKQVRIWFAGAEIELVDNEKWRQGIRAAKSNSCWFAAIDGQRARAWPE